MYSRPDIVIIVGQPEEMNAVRECQKLGIPTVTILDTDCDPSLADLFVPANDDSIASLRLILNQFLHDIQTGQKKLRGVDAKQHVEQKPLIGKTVQNVNPYPVKKLNPKPRVKPSSTLQSKTSIPNNDLVELQPKPRLPQPNV
jgi:ribosomal protein S2